MRKSTNNYAPPGWITIYQLLGQISMKHFQEKIDLNMTKGIQKESSPAYIVHTPFTNFFIGDCFCLEQIKCIYKKNQYPARVVLHVIQLCVYNKDSEKQEIEGIKERPYSIANAQDCLFFENTFLTLKQVRDWLSDSSLQAYALHQLQHKKIPQEFWHEDVNWYRLRATGGLCGDIPSIAKSCFVESVVYFNEQDVERFLYKQKPGEEADLHIYKNLRSMRAANRFLYQLLDHQDNLSINTGYFQGSLTHFIKNKQTKKTTLIDQLKIIAVKEFNYIVSDKIQIELGGINEADKIREKNQTMISMEDIKAIATLLRSLEEQLGNTKKKFDT